MSVSSHTTSEAYDVSFINVGRTNRCWTERLHQEPTEPVLVRLVRKQKVLASRDIECGDGMVIVGGCRPVGRYEIRKVPA